MRLYKAKLTNVGAKPYDYVPNRIEHVFGYCEQSMHGMFSRAVGFARNAAGYAVYDNDPANDEKFGKLYTWYAAMGLAEGDDATAVPEHTRGICPEGWAIPTQEEYILMVENSGSLAQAKEANLLYWYPGLEGQLPVSGFNARGGWYNPTTGGFEDLLIGAKFWTTTPATAEGTQRIAVDFGLCTTEDYIALRKNSGASVRCIKLCE